MSPIDERPSPRAAPRSARAGALAIALAVALVACDALDDGGVVLDDAPPFTDACLRVTEAALALCATSDMARPTRTGPIPFEHPRYDLGEGPLALRAARDETLAFQLVARRLDATAPRALRVTATPWTLEGDAGAPAPPIGQRLFAAHYVRIEDGRYTTGVPTAVLPTPADYPDALVPRTRPCGAGGGPLFDELALPAETDRNQALWIDLHVGAETPPGSYARRLVVEAGDTRVEIPIELEVVAARLPARPSIDAVGEIYRPYAVEGAGFDPAAPAWQTMSRCYQQSAHRHRLIFLERVASEPDAAALERHAEIHGPALDGELFTAAAGYSGPGEGTPVGVWRTPWPQTYDLEVARALTPDEIARYRALAGDWARLAAREGWNATRWFAYVFDEVDGPAALEGLDGTSARRAYLARVHEDMRRVQRALDEGAPNDPIDLIWTSHANPARWTDDPALDLRGAIRLWAPNAHAADTAFLAERVAAGERAWFYHSGHPAVGAHAINLPGTDLRSWGVAGARYGFQGQLMWAINFGDDERPYAAPTWRATDDRFGNGTLVYPGNRLGDIGYARAPGPVPSMRLKAWRRGLQDAELYRLARERDAAAADALLLEIVPRAFTDAVETGVSGQAWATDVAAWEDFRDALLDLLD